MTTAVDAGNFSKAKKVHFLSAHFALDKETFKCSMQIEYTKSSYPRVVLLFCCCVNLGNSDTFILTAFIVGHLHVGHLITDIYHTKAEKNLKILFLNCFWKILEWLFTVVMD